MSAYALYDPATGDIRAFIRCAPRNAALQVRDGLVVMALPDGVPGKPDDYRVTDGEVVER